jgi:hypothetical protein
LLVGDEDERQDDGTEEKRIRGGEWRREEERRE